MLSIQMYRLTCAHILALARNAPNCSSARVFAVSCVMIVLRVHRVCRTGVIEYICFEVIEHAGDLANEQGSMSIRLHHIAEAVLEDQEMAPLHARVKQLLIVHVRAEESRVLTRSQANAACETSEAAEASDMVLPYSVWEAAMRGDIAVVGAWLVDGGDVNACDGENALLNAVAQYAIQDDVQSHTPEREAVLNLCLNFGAEVDARDSDGDSALMLACNANFERVAVLLLGRGANPSLRGSVQEGSGSLVTALHTAAGHGYSRLVNLLLARKAELNVQDSDGCNEVMCAAAAGHLTIVTRLLQAGARVDSKNKEGKYAMTVAYENGYDEVGILISQHLTAQLESDPSIDLDATKELVRLKTETKTLRETSGIRTHRVIR